MIRATLIGVARKVETTITLTDDLDGTKADRTVGFAVDGTSYEIDLSKRNAAAFEKALRPYVERARKVKPTRIPRGRRRAAGSLDARPDIPEIRAWARANGYKVSDRGRIAAKVMDAYNASR